MENERLGLVRIELHRQLTMARLPTKAVLLRSSKGLTSLRSSSTTADKEKINNGVRA